MEGITPRKAGILAPALEALTAQNSKRLLAANLHLCPHLHKFEKAHEFRLFLVVRNRAASYTSNRVGAISDTSRRKFRSACSWTLRPRLLFPHTNRDGKQLSLAVGGVNSRDFSRQPNRDFANSVSNEINNGLNCKLFDRNDYCGTWDATD